MLGSVYEALSVHAGWVSCGIVPARVIQATHLICAARYQQSKPDAQRQRKPKRARIAKTDLAELRLGCMRLEEHNRDLKSKLTIDECLIRGVYLKVGFGGQCRKSACAMWDLVVALRRRRGSP